MKKTIFLFVALLLVVLSSCKKEEESNLIEGSITFDFLVAPGDFYIYMDSDGDPSNGSKIYGTGTLAGTEGGVNYSFDTENIPDGDYYIYAGFDLESDTNMDPLNIQVWEGLGWYGNEVDATMPAAAPVKKLSGTYDFVIFGLNR